MARPCRTRPCSGDLVRGPRSNNLTREHSGGRLRTIFLGGRSGGPEPMGPPEPTRPQPAIGSPGWLQPLGPPQAMGRRGPSYRLSPSRRVGSTGSIPLCERRSQSRAAFLCVCVCFYQRPPMGALHHSACSMLVPGRTLRVPWRHDISCRSYRLRTHLGYGMSCRPIARRVLQQRDGLMYGLTVANIWPR